ncbi:MAG: ATP:cob(I)alamin adenosyltransferase [Treponema sp.]|jgi:cob(I)alamin adenosyltransferase|nr:ATP:cob(I)alamin adenosyltransferase [Treponema sp.]
MSIVTKKGDGGNTFLPGKTEAVQKDHPRIECLGALDELDAFLVVSEISLMVNGSSPAAKVISEIRKELSTVVMPAAAGSLVIDIPGLNTDWLERQIIKMEEKNPLRGFVRTWTRAAAANLNAARSICRRAERRMTSAAKSGQENAGAALLPWLNRLSDLLFMLAVSEELR